MAGNFIKGLLGFFVGILTLGVSFVLGAGGILAGSVSGNPGSLVLLIPFLISILLIVSPVYFWLLKPSGSFVAGIFSSSGSGNEGGEDE